MPIKKKSVKIVSNIEAQVEEYANVTSTIKVLDDKKKKLSNDIKEYAKSNGVKDDKGSFYCENESFIFGAVAKKSMKLNEEAMIQYLRDNNLSEGVVVTVEKIDNEALDRLINDGSIPVDVVESMVDVSTSYSVSVKAKEAVVDIVQEVDLPLAASSKPRLKFGGR